MEPKRARKVIGIILAVIGVLLAGILTLYLMLENTKGKLEQATSYPEESMEPTDIAIRYLMKNIKN